MKINQALPIGAILRSNLRAYKIVEILGAGTFGITYKVVSNIMVGNVEISTFFAIKECFLNTCYRDIDKCRVLSAPTERQTFIDCKKDFIKEAKMLNKLSGQTKHIVQVNEVFEYNDTAYYVMKYLDGGDLDSFIKSHGAMDEAQALNIIKPIIQAVEKLHKEKLLHLDIKPSNIMLMSSMGNQSSYPVLIDFGIAKHYSSKGKATSAMFAKGASDGYAPMEQYASIPIFTPQIDIYALAATLLHFLTGKQPPTSFKLKDANINSIIPPSVSMNVRNAITHALAPQGAMRTPTVSQFLDELEGKGTSSIYTGYAEEAEEDNKTRPLRGAHGFGMSSGMPYTGQGTPMDKPVTPANEPAPPINSEPQVDVNDDNNDVSMVKKPIDDSDNVTLVKDSDNDSNNVTIVKDSYDDSESQNSQDYAQGGNQEFNQEDNQGYDQGDSQGHEQGGSQGYEQGGSQGYDQGGTQRYDQSSSQGYMYPRQKSGSGSGRGRKILIFTLTMIICLGLFVGGRMLYKSHKQKVNQEKLEKINNLKEATRKAQEEKHEKEEKIKAKQDSILKQDSIYKSGYYSGK